MKLDLREIIEIPGAKKSFECTLDPETLDFPSVKDFISPPRAAGYVQNSAGVLTLIGELTAEMTAYCDRCGDTFPLTKKLSLSVPLAAGLIDEESPDIFPLEGDCADLSYILSACLILEMDTKLLCSPSCKGLCEGCGANLNNSACVCGKKTDPRFAVLEQLLNK